MKQVLLIDAPQLFREFLKEKLTAEKVTVDVAQGDRDAFTKLVSQLPSVVIIDVPQNFADLMDFLEKKKQNPNTKSIPVILTGPVLSREQIAVLPQYHVVKYFNKPIKFDVFFESIGKILRTSFSIDTTPCILELHLNDNIIFIEIAQGLNREKLMLLKYKITEMIDQNHLTSPKIVLMMTDLTLSFIDGSNLELLFDNVIADHRVLRKNVKVLALDNFTKELIVGHAQYDGIKVAENLSSILSSLVDSGSENDVADVISDKILTATEEVNEGAVQMRFYSESGVQGDFPLEENQNLHVAIVDDDPLIRQILQATFTKENITTSLFDSGSEFLSATNKTLFDAVILDIFMPGLSGFDILANLHNKRYQSPVIVYSTAYQREAVIQALSLGAKTYLIKPLKPELVLAKVMEEIKNFKNS